MKGIRRYLVGLAVLVTATVFGADSRAQSHPEAGRPFVTAYGWADYDASPENWTITQDARGVLYVGNLGGVLEYDGAAWRLTPLPNRTAIRALTTDANGRVWVGGHDDFGYLTPGERGRLEFVSLLDHVPEARRGFGPVWQALPTPEGVYFLTDENLFRWDGAAMRVWPLATEGHNISVVDGTLYLMQLERGMLRLDDDELELLPGGDRFAGSGKVYFSLPYGDGRVLLGARSGLVVFDPTDADDPYTEFPTEADDLITEGRLYLPGAVLPGGRFALGTRAAGLVVIDREGRLLHHVTAEDGLPGDDVSYVFVDQAGDVWLTHRQGLSRVEIDAPLSYYDERAGLVTDPITVARHDGRLYVATDDGLFRLEPGAQALRQIPGVTGQVLDLLPMDGELLVVANSGLYRLDGERAVYLHLGLRDIKLNASHQWRRDPNVAFVSHSHGVGVIRSSGDGWELAGPLPGADGDMESFAEAPDGALWVGTNVGELVRIDLGSALPPFPRAEAITYGTADGLVPGWVQPFVLGGRVFASVEGGGVLRFDAATSRFARDPTFDVVRSNHPLAEVRLHQAPDGAVWVAQRAGRPAVLRPTEDGYEAMSGWLGRLQDARIRTIYAEGDGVGWLLGARRLVRYDSRASEATQPPPEVLFRRVSAGGHVWFDGAGPRVPVEVAPGTGPVRIQYAAARYGSAQYRTRLDGLEDGWAAWSPEAAREFTGLRPGHYRLAVQARGASGEAGPEAVYGFVVLPPWWQTWWAYLAYALLAIGLLTAAYRARRRRHELRHRMEMEHLEAENLRALDHAKSRFFANVSHEFRTPLTLTIGPLDDIQAGLYGELPAPLAQQVALARRNAGRVLDLINQILDVARLEAGRTPLRASPVDLGAFVEAVAQPFRAAAERKAISFEVDRPAAPVEVYADAGQFEKVVANLLSNALKFTPSAGTVRVIVTAEDGVARVAVRDSGPGIPAADLPYVFDRFYQVNEASQTQLGTGIGLALAKEIVDLHGGALTVESDEGFGSTFTVTLPLGRAHLAPEQVVDDEPWTPDAVRPSLLTEPGGDGLDSEGSAVLGEDADVTTVLVVEDHPEVRAYVRRHLAPEYRVLEASDGEAGLALARERLPDLVISDVMMPKLDGLSLCRALKSDPATDFIPVILLTAKAAPEDKLEGLAELADDYLTKPFDPAELRVRIANLIAVRARLRERFQQDGFVPVPDATASIRLSTPEPVTSADDAFLEGVAEVIEARLGDETLSVAGLAEAVSMSRGHLHRQLKALLGTSPSELIRTLRLERAAHLLEGGAGTVSEIAYAVGFKSVGHFSDSFMHAHGCRPSDYAARAETAEDEPAQ